MQYIFINLSNHPSANWGEKQRRDAEAFGEIMDIPFPAVEASMSGEEVYKVAETMVEQIVALHPAMVMCQGESTLTYHMVRGFKEHGIRVCAACSERKVWESLDKDGRVRKVSEFQYVRLREY